MRRLVQGTVGIGLFGAGFLFGMGRSDSPAPPVPPASVPCPVERPADPRVAELEGEIARLDHDRQALQGRLDTLMGLQDASMEPVPFPAGWGPDDLDRWVARREEVCGGDLDVRVDCEEFPCVGLLTWPKDSGVGWGQAACREIGGPPGASGAFTDATRNVMGSFVVFSADPEMLWTPRTVERVQLVRQSLLADVR
ncbi:MAG: hypothetical protein H6734_15830 [Alphaproteobacteria bacterium]|nr:hypothetical protein [Alphaproteobacteria bacterium]